MSTELDQISMQPQGRKVGICIDFSSTSKLAFEWYLSNVSKKNDFVYLLHCIEPIVQYGPIVGLDTIYVEMYQQISATQKTQAAKLLQETAQPLVKKEIPHESRIYEGDVRELLLGAITDLKTDLVVIGSRGLGPVDRMIIGSVSEYLLHNANCPVLVYKHMK